MKTFLNSNFFRCIVLACTAWIFALSIPPMQSPDENQHIARAYLLAHGELLLQNPPQRMSGGYLDKGLHRFITDSLKISGDSSKKMSESDVQALKNLHWTGTAEREFMEIPGTGYYFPIIYAPHALGLLLGEQLNLSIHTSYQITRFITIVASLAFMAWAFKLMPASPAVLGIIMLPMSLFQLLSPTLDGLTNGMSLAAIGLFLFCLKTPGQHRNFYLLSLLIFLLATTRIHLISLIIFIFIIAWNERSRLFSGIAFLVSFLSAAWIYFSIRHTVDNRVPREMSSVEMLIHYLGHPGEFIAVLYRTLTSSDRMTFYWHSFVGNLGWLDTPLKSIFYIILPALLLALLTASLFSKDRPTATPAARFHLLLAAILSTLAIFAALLISWTPFPAVVINGIQGRYFTVPMILFFCSLQGLFRYRNDASAWIGRTLLMTFMACSSIAFFIAIFERFHALPTP